MSSQSQDFGFSCVRARIQSPGKKARLIHSSQAEFFFFLGKKQRYSDKGVLFCLMLYIVI